MAYIMNSSIPAGRPSKRYIDSIKQGYIDNNLDITFLYKSIELNKLECS